jgi:hypothetical protein
VICSPNHFCGALPVDRELLEFDEMLFGLCVGFVT